MLLQAVPALGEAEMSIQHLLESWSGARCRSCATGPRGYAQGAVREAKETKAEERPNVKDDYEMFVEGLKGIL